jgi:hypothetical protein
MSVMFSATASVRHQNLRGGLLDVAAETHFSIGSSDVRPPRSVRRGRGESWGFESGVELSTCPEQGKHRVVVSEGGLVP